jgi:4-amino-4-deoxy-L-arabinose transferase-like glycosyltransferase
MAFILGPAPQEAYYWNYAQHPALSYFDHPPMTAYLISFFTIVFGDNSFGIHFTAIFISIALSIVLYYFIAALFDKRTAFWTVLASSTAFIFALGSIIITPDGPLLLFWLLFMMAFYRAASQNDLKWWFISGIFLGAAMTSKYTAAFTGLGAAIYILASPQRRRHLVSIGPYLMVAAAFVVFLPVIVWNYQNDWTSFCFQSSRRAAEAVRFRFDYLGAFIGTQIAMLGVFLMPVFIWGLTKSVRRIFDDDRLRFLLCFSIPMIAFFSVLSPFVYIKMNWLAPAYLAGAALAVYFFLDCESRIWLIFGKIALAFSLVLTLLVHVLIISPYIGIGKADTINGWPELADKAQSIQQEMSATNQPFICGYEYKTASELKFYLPGHPEIVSNAIVGENGLAYDFWSNPDTLVGRDCIFVYDSRNRYRGKLEDYFQKVDEPQIVTTSRGSRKITDYYIYRCYNYRGVK